MNRLLISLFCMAPLLTWAQNITDVNSVWQEGAQWDVYYTVDADAESPEVSEEDEVRVTYRLLHADDGYMVLEKTETINDVEVETQLQGYIRNDNDKVIYVRPVLEDGSIGDECLLYDFQTPYEYGNTMKYGLQGGVVKEEFIDWREDSLDYYMLNNGDGHCLPAWKGVIYKYGYIGGPMELFLMEAVSGKPKRPKTSNISHVIFSTKGGRKVIRKNDAEEENEEQNEVIIPYDKMLTIGTTWECLAVSTEQEGKKHTYSIQVKGDTLIGKRCCKLVYSPEYNRQMTMFEEGRKVYVLNSKEEPEVLLDFGLQKGDWIDDVMAVVNIGYQDNSGYDYRIITIDSGFDCGSFFAGDTAPWNYYLIEGIGANKDEFLKGPSFVKEENTISYLLRCWKDNNLVYQTPGYETVTGVSEIRTTAIQPIYDLNGRRLKTIPQKGIFIIGNKIIFRK